MIRVIGIIMGVMLVLFGGGCGIVMLGSAYSANAAMVLWWLLWGGVPLVAGALLTYFAWHHKR